MSEQNDDGERQILRAFSDPYHLQMQPDLFAQSLELARLSIDLARLARLKGGADTRSPAAFLPEAVALVNEAALHAAYHPKIVSDEAFARLERRLNSRCVPFERLYGREAIKAAGGGLWTSSFERNADPKGMNEAFRKHFIRMVGEGLKERVRVKGQAKPHSLRAWLAYELMIGRGDTAGAVSFLEAGHYAKRTGVLNEALAEIGRGNGFQWARRVVNAWRDLVAAKAAVEVRLQWEKNGIPRADLAAFAESQVRRYKSKGNGRKAVKVTKKGKDHSAATEKHGAGRKNAERSKVKGESS